MFTVYAEALQYLYENLPVFQRIGAAAYNKDLGNTIRLMEALDNPQHKFKSIHVAGTNGKGSTAHMLAAVLQSSGYRTGLYTSPHLKSFTERIRIDGVEVQQQFVVDFVNRIQPAIEMIKPSFFEITVAMAFDYFVQQHVDVAVIEVGMGGRLDSTNVIIPEVSVITNIGWDHKEFLGDTLELIAGEKAGIIKPNVPVVISERQSHSEPVFRAAAKQHQAPLHVASDEYSALREGEEGSIRFTLLKNGMRVLENLYLPLQGVYQQKNILGVMKTLEVLHERGWNISPESIAEGLRNTVAQTGLKGRWQKLADQPLTICDTGHNEDGIREIVAQLKAQRFANLHMVIGMVKDKDITAVLHLLPKDANYYFCQANLPRALNADVLAMQAKALGLRGEVIPDVNEAIRQAQVKARADDMIFIGGSTFVVAEIDQL